MENKTKDCKLVFTDKDQPDYEFSSVDLAKALKYMKDKDLPVWMIETPWCCLSVMDSDLGRDCKNCLR